MAQIHFFAIKPTVSEFLTTLKSDKLISGGLFITTTIYIEDLESLFKKCSHPFLPFGFLNSVDILLISFFIIDYLQNYSYFMTFTMARGLLIVYFGI